jgi:hypothetical protein
MNFDVLKEVIKKDYPAYFNILAAIKKTKKTLASINPYGKPKGNVLISYIIPDFFLRKKSESFSNKHSCEWESFQIARTFVDLGYSVDLIDYRDQVFIPKKKYHFFIDIHTNMERIAPYLNADCTKVLHLTGAHWLFNNHAEYKRIIDIQERRNITLTPKRTATPHRGLDVADCATVLGNQFAMSTIKPFDKPIHRLPSSTTNIYPYHDNRDYENSRTRFLWLGSKGLVLKGLHLVLEAFADMPEYNLTVCGPVEHEKDFEAAFYRELYQCPNINTIGWIDVGSQEFLEITKNSVGVIHPSCAEGCAGSVIVCLHAGLIPIVSYESGVDVDAFGFQLVDSSIEAIKEAVKTVASLPQDELQKRSKTAWDFARSSFTRAIFSEAYKNFASDLIKSSEM